MGSDFLVTIGEDIFKVKESDHQGAKYAAAQQFKSKYHLICPLTAIVEHARARQVSLPFAPLETTKALLKELTF
jgi:hypothetical protein